MGRSCSSAAWRPGTLGIPGGIGLVAAVNRDGKHVTLAPLWWVVATVVPAWLGTRRPAARSFNPNIEVAN